MPIRITLKCGLEFMIPGESWEAAEHKSVMGKIKVMLSNGHMLNIFKSEVALAEEIPDAEYKAKLEANKKAQDEAAAKEKADKKAEADRLAALETRKLKNRIKRFFHLG